MSVSDPRISETSTWHVVSGQDGSWEIFKPAGSRVASFVDRYDAEYIAKDKRTSGGITSSARHAEVGGCRLISAP